MKSGIKRAAWWIPKGRRIEDGGWNHTQTSARDIVNRLKDFMSIKPDDRLLEIGCGAGGMVQYLDSDYVSLDYSKPSVQKCMGFFRKPQSALMPTTFHLRMATLTSPLLMDVMYFPSVEYAKQTIREMRRVTKGMLFFGELPMESHEPKHLLFEKALFEKIPYCKRDLIFRYLRQIRLGI